mmetsp:Transcript_58905/g.53065  ORF Transcript_58905/g.53065 Transcript_58905/m.53065 type:complete len:97 (+) Transcript_58905:2-292(+)
MGDNIRERLEENDSIEIYALCKYPLIEAMEQVVNGMNYWIKISLCDDSYANVYFYVPFGVDAKPTIEAIQFPRHRHDELAVFRDNDIVPKKNFYSQ